jgi:LysR family transcriptional activator of nhaA
MNHKHLFYFWKVAKAGSVARAAESIHVTPQTLSGQIGLLEESLGTPLFRRQGRALKLTEAGALALQYADEMFALSAELETRLKQNPLARPTEFRVGVSDAVPKSLVFALLQPAMVEVGPVRLVCREWRIDRLLAELSVHKLDLVISDGPIPPSINVRAYNHRLLDSGLSFLVGRQLAIDPARFPACLDDAPMLLPGEDSALRQPLQRWLEKKNLLPRVVGEFDDSALITAFGREGLGVFVVPTVVEDELTAGGEFVLLGRTQEMRASYYAISVERRLTHSCVLAVTASARRINAEMG